MKKILILSLFMGIMPLFSSAQEVAEVYDTVYVDSVAVDMEMVDADVVDSVEVDTIPLRSQMRDVFRRMPTDMLPYLTATNRLDFIDFMDSQMKAEVTNALGGRSLMIRLTDSFTQLVLSESFTLELRLFDTTIPVDGSMQVVCVVRTYGTDIRESTVEFYSLRWHKLNASDYMEAPTGMVVATLGEEAPTLTLMPVHRLNAPASEEQEEIVSVSKILKWNENFLKEIEN